MEKLIILGLILSSGATVLCLLLLKSFINDLRKQVIDLKDELDRFKEETAPWLN